MNEAQQDDEVLCQREKNEDKEMKWKDSNDEDFDGKVKEINITWSKRKEG